MRISRRAYIKNLSRAQRRPADAGAGIRRKLFDTVVGLPLGAGAGFQGNLYAGGGTGAKLFRIPPDGKGKMLAEFDALESMPSPSIPRTACTPPPRPTARSIASRRNGKPEVFYDPKAKYIWALAFDGQGDLFVATGDPGEIHRVTPDGKGKVSFKTDETHVRSMAIDGRAT